MNYIPPVRFVPSLAPRTRASSGFYGTSGALPPTQVADFQGTLVWLGHLPVSQVTGREPIAPASVLRAFQTNYNAEQARLNYRFSPRTLTVDGQWGPNTQQALQNYVAAARAANFGLAPGQTIFSTVAPGVSITPLGGSTATAPVPGKGGTTAIQPTPSTPAPRPAPLPAPAPAPASTSSFPVLPVVAIGVGALAIGGALYVRSRRKRGGKG